MSIPIDRPLTDSERSIMLHCAVTSIARQSDCTAAVAADALDDLAAQGDVWLRADAHDARIVVCGHSIAHMDREDLAAAALEEQNR